MHAVEGRNFDITWHGIYFAVGFFILLTTYWHFLYLAGIHDSFTNSINSLLIALGFIAGSKSIKIACSWRALLENPRKLIFKNGSSFYGGVAGLLLASWFITRRAETLPPFAAFDAVFMSLPLFQVFLRLGCASYGCCHGGPYAGPGSIRPTEPASPAFRSFKGEPMHPTQLSSIVKNLVILMCMLAIFLTFPYEGVPTVTWLLLYPSVRFLVDLTRSREEKTHVRGFRRSQIVSIALFAIGIALAANLSFQLYEFSGAELLAPGVNTADVTHILIVALLFFPFFGISVRKSNRSDSG